MTGYVYAIDNGRGCVKIGWTQNPLRRLSEMNVSDAEKLTLVGYASGTKEQEAEAHTLLSPWRQRGEWFRIEGHVVTFMNMLAGAQPSVSTPKRRSLRNRVRPFAIANVRLAEALGVDKASITRWAKGRIPAERVIEVERITGIPRADLRPDLYAKELAQ
jgi:hypothetical protein